MEQVKYLTLHSAYNLIGQAVFQKSWDQESVYLSPTRVPFDFGFPKLFDPAEDPERVVTQDTEPYEQPATARQVEQFKRVRSELLRAVALVQVPFRAIDQAGDEAPLPDAAWVEGQTRFQWWLPESQVQEQGGAQRVWTIHLERAGLAAWAARLGADEVRQERQERARNSRGGRPCTLDWERTHREIDTQLERLGDGASNSAVAGAVIKVMGERDAPSISRLREAVSRRRKVRAKAAEAPPS